MNDQARGLVNGSKRIRSKQSAWMAHWTQASRNAIVETRTYAASGNAEPVSSARDDRLKTGLKVTRSAEGLMLVKEKTFEVMNESAGMNPRSLENKEMRNSVFKNRQDIDSVPEPRSLFDIGIERGKAVCYESGTELPYVDHDVAAAKRNFFRVHQFLDEGSSKNPHDWMTTPSSVNEIRSAAPKTWQSVESSSHTEPYRLKLGSLDFDQEKTRFCSVANRTPIFSSNQAKDMVHVKEMGRLLLPDSSMNARFHESNTPLLLDVPSTSDLHLPSSGQELFQEVKKYSACDHDVEAMRICTLVDSVKGTTVDFPMFSKTTHSVVITKKTEVGFSKENNILGSTRVVRRINGNMPSGFHGFSSFFPQGNRGVRLQSLSSSTDSEAKEGNVGNVKASKATIKNASSEDTDTLDTDPLVEKNLFSGANSSPSAKVDATSSREVGLRWPNAGQPDINLELPALPAAASLLDNTPSSSRTQSLEMDPLVTQVEPHKRKSKLSLDDSLKTDSSDRWVKRLKLSSSNSSSQGIKNPVFPESTSHEKISKFFSRILKNHISSSKVNPTDHRKESMAPVESGNLSKEQDFSVDPLKMGKELLLSHTWIQRWLCNESRITQKKPQAMVVCVPQSSKLALDDIQKKQFPSIGAMALMGKAMNGFQQCELQKRGAFTVWNTKAF